MEFLWFVIIGAAAAWIAGQLMNGYGFGLLGDIAVGVIGAFIGGFVFRSIGVELIGAATGILLGAFIAALVLLFVVRLFTGRRRGRKVWS